MPPCLPVLPVLLLLPPLLLNINPAAAGCGHKEEERGVVFQKGPSPYHRADKETLQSDREDIRQPG